jgi:WD40 repeat protein
MTAETAPAADVQPKAKIFISYSRKDLPFADRLAAALKARDFEPLIDRDEIYAFEDWWKRIESLIVKADTVIFVLSPDAVASEVCAKEVEFAALLNKRFAPIVYRRVKDEAVPVPLRRLNFIFFDDPNAFDINANRLAEALETDIEWIRRHTEFTQFAQRWHHAGRPGPGGLLLRPPILDEAEGWMAWQPRGAPGPPQVTKAFIAASRSAFDLEQAAKKAHIDRYLISQSRLLADLARQQIRRGDVGTAISLAIEALPHSDSAVDRPYVREAERVLFDAHHRLHEEFVLAGHEKRINSAVFCPYGLHLITAADDKTARIWNSKTGAEIAVLVGHAGAVQSAAFCPSGKFCVTASSDNTARRWDLGGHELEVFAGHAGPVSSAAFSPDGGRVVTSSEDKTGRIWDVRSGQTIAQFSAPNGIHGAVFSPDGLKVLATCHDRRPRLWDAQSGEQIAVLTHDKHVSAVSFSRDGRFVVAACDDATAWVWEVETARNVFVFRGHDDEVNGVAFHPDGNWVITASNDKTACVWDFNSGQEVHRLQGHEGPVLGALFSSDGMRILTWSIDGSARVWHRLKPIDSRIDEQIAVLRGHLTDVTAAAFAPDGRRIATASADTTARLWRVPQASVLEHDDVVRNIAFHPKEQILVTASSMSEIKIWRAESGEQIAQFGYEGGEIGQLEFNADGTRIVVRSEGKGTWLLDTLSWQWFALARTGITLARFSPSGTHLATVTKDNTLELWNAADGGAIWSLDGQELTTLIENKADLQLTAFSPDGRLVATAANDGMVRIWNADSGAALTVLGHEHEIIYEVAFSADGRRVLVNSGTQTSRPFTDERTSDGRYVLRVSFDDRSACLCDADNGQVRAFLSGDIDYIRHWAFSPGSRRLATVCALSKAVHIWQVFPTTDALIDAALESVPRVLTPDQRNEFFLDPEPPEWSVHSRKWPYRKH